MNNLHGLIAYTVVSNDQVVVAAVSWGLAALLGFIIERHPFHGRHLL